MGTFENELTRFDGVQGARESAWLLAGRMSPRDTIRVAATDVDGKILNSYPLSVSVGSSPPTSTWAIHLADATGLFRWVVFDFDGTGSGVDAGELVQVCEGLGLDVVLADSGRGHHVWIGLAEGVHADVVRELARLAKGVWSSLDVSPLMNPSTGAVRPPGAPHRHRGHSKVVAGDLWALVDSPGTRRADIERLKKVLASRVVAEAPEADYVGLVWDEAGHPYLSGRRRPLPARTVNLLSHRVSASDDASALLFGILVSAAHCRWQLVDVEQLLDHPGMERVRSSRTANGRRPRPPSGTRSTSAELARQWAKAVTAAARAQRTPTAGSDPEWLARAGVVTDAVEALQRRADASPGRWVRGGGPTDRRVLDVLCLLSLQSVQIGVEADIRRLGIQAGISRETARRALLRLSDSGWITSAGTSNGRTANTWKLNSKTTPKQLSTTSLEEGVSQVRSTPPALADPLLITAKRLAGINELTKRLKLCVHDVFTPAGLGLLAGNLYSNLAWRESGEGVECGRAIRALEKWGLTDSGRADLRDQLACQLGLAGVLVDRAERYRVERELWAWWSAELEWMSSPRPDKLVWHPGRRCLVRASKPRNAQWPPYPRSGGRGDHSKAMSQIRQRSVWTQDQLRLAA